MAWNLITNIWIFVYTFVLINVASFSLPQTTEEPTIEMPNVSITVNQSFGYIYDIDVVMQSFLSFPAKIAYFTANRQIINKALYPEHRQFHSFVKMLIYNNYQCSVSWSEVDALFKVFPSQTRKDLGWELKAALQTTEHETIFNPCVFRGVWCIPQQNKSSSDADSEYRDITYVGPYYISAIAINRGSLFTQNINSDRKMLATFLNYSLPQNLTMLTLMNSKIYGFSFANMPKDLLSFKVASCIFDSISGHAFLWNSIPPAIGSIEIINSVIDDNSKDNATWTSSTSFKDIDANLNLSTNFDDLESIPTWHKPNLKHFVIQDFVNFRNDLNTFNVNQFLLHIPIIAPRLKKIHLNMLDLNGFVYIEQVRKVLNPTLRSAQKEISLHHSGLDMIGYGTISCGIFVAPEDDAEKMHFMREMHVFENFERFFECQQLRLKMIDQLSKEYGVERDHDLLSYDDVMEIYGIYHGDVKSNVSEMDAPMNTSFHSIVDICYD